MTRTLTISLALFAMLALPACGLQGDLTRADPLWGTPDEREAANLPGRDIDSGVSVIRDDLEEEEEFEDEDARSDAELLGGSDGLPHVGFASAQACLRLHLRPL